jgi:hypothetical protein
MRKHLFAVTLFAVACATAARSSGAPSLNGVYLATLAVDGRSTYTGSMTLAPAGRDSVTGNMRLTSPISVDMVLGASLHGDSITMRGTYSAANGCTGSFSAPLRIDAGGAGAQGRFQLIDRCAGTLTGAFRATR